MRDTEGTSRGGLSGYVVLRHIPPGSNRGVRRTLREHGNLTGLNGRPAWVGRQLDHLPPNRRVTPATAVSGKPGVAWILAKTGESGVTREAK